VLTKTDAEKLLQLIPTFFALLPEIALAITDREKITDLVISPGFDLDYFKVGMDITQFNDRGSAKAIQTGAVQTDVYNRLVFGSRLAMRNIPFVDENGVIAGTLCVVTVRNHPIKNAFDDFAPIIAEMFPDGAALYITDLDKFICRQSSDKFDVPKVQVGVRLTEDAVAWQSIKQKRMVIQKTPAEIYGAPLLVASYPLYDSENNIIGTFGLATPTRTADTLQNIAVKLNQSLVEITAVLEELAATSSNIMNNQAALNKNIEEISYYSQDINSVLTLIKKISDETKMLGLNAAIEAARAGDAGAGFSIVAKEIRKLSDQSSSTVSSIRELTKNIIQKVENTLQNSERYLRSTEEQAAASQQVSINLQEISEMSHELSTIAKNLS
jgi:hypothetical protein